MGQLRCRGVSDRVLEDLEKYVRAKYGKKHTVWGQTVERAISEFLAHHLLDDARTHAENDRGKGE